MAADLDKPSLNASHRCDACGSRAYVRVNIETGINDAGYVDNGELYWCCHHAREHMPVIKARSIVLHILDETRFLTEHVKDDRHVIEGQAAKRPGT